MSCPVKTIWDGWGVGVVELDDAVGVSGIGGNRLPGLEIGRRLQSVSRHADKNVRAPVRFRLNFPRSDSRSTKAVSAFPL